METSSGDKKPVRVTIFNQSFTVLAPGDPAEVHALARELDELMVSISSKSGTSDAARVAVLACFHLADRLRTIEQELARLRQTVDAKGRQFSLMLDQVVGGR